jgi:deazaflavin-dependent oxidoreductase (nitroreductase family)
MDYLNWADRSWPLLRKLMGGHTAIYRASHGLVGHRFPGGPPSLLLDHVGAKSHEKRTSPLVYTVDGENLILVASKGGYPKHPAWFHNLLANPDTTVQVGSRRRNVHARVADPRERERLWPMVLAVYGGYADYQRRTEREIPLVILQPR